MRNKLFWVLLGLVFLYGCQGPSSQDSKEIKQPDEPIQIQPERTVIEPRPVLDLAQDSEAKNPANVQEQVLEEVLVTAAKQGKPMGNLNRRLAAVSPAHVAHYQMPAYQDYGRDQYQKFTDNGWQWSESSPVSTFAVDVDTASYTNLRRSLSDGYLPPGDAIRVEEFVNYFDYQYPAPADAHPFGIYQEFGPSPWNKNHRLLHIGINTTPPASVKDLPPANLVFLVDVSGSMQAPNKLHLLKRALKMLTRQMRAEDRIAMVVYAGAAGTVLESTAGDEKAKILAAIDKLQAGGSTNGAAGIHLAYQLAEQHKIEHGINRVLLATDGDFNVGTTGTDQLEDLVEQKRKSGVALTVLGFGSGNLNDHMMQKIAQIGDGNAAYIDTMHEARKVLVDEIGATLNIVARDVKIQVEFNPAVIAGYRLVGYETRHLNREDFNNDKVDAGEVGEGHSVTAIYEVVMVGDQTNIIDPLRYADSKPGQNAEEPTSEAAYVKVRYKTEHGGASKLVTQVVSSDSMQPELDKTSSTYRFSGAVAWFAQLLRNGEAVQNHNWKDLLALAESAKGMDQMGYRSEFLKLVRTAESLQPGDTAASGR
ncbi:MAG: VWA domain-containing protein [Pseudomonadota bacterium]